MREDGQRWKSHTMNIAEDVFTPGTVPNLVTTAVLLRTLRGFSLGGILLSCLHSHVQSKKR